MGFLFEPNSFTSEALRIKKQYDTLADVDANEYSFNDQTVKEILFPNYWFNGHDAVNEGQLREMLLLRKLRVAVNCGSPTVVALFVYLLKKGFYFDLTTDVDRSGEILDRLETETFDMVNVGYSTIVPISTKVNKHKYRVYFFANKTKCSFYAFGSKFPNSARFALNKKEFSNSKSALRYGFGTALTARHELDHRTGNDFMDFLLVDPKDVRDVVIFDNMILTKLFPYLKAQNGSTRMQKLDSTSLPRNLSDTISNFAYGNAVLINSDLYHEHAAFFKNLLNLFRRGYEELRTSKREQMEVARILLSGKDYTKHLLDCGGNQYKPCLQHLYDNVVEATQRNLMGKYTPFSVV